MLGRPVENLFHVIEFSLKVISMDHDKVDRKVMHEVLYDDKDREDVNIDELEVLLKAVVDKLFS